MELRLDGRVALVTGASRGIGRAIAQIFSEAGARVMLTSRNEQALAEVASALPNEATWMSGNAGDADTAIACVAATLERFSRLDILVNNAATSPHLGPMIDMETTKADKTVQVNQRAVLHWSQAAWRGAMCLHGGCIINMASVGGLVTASETGYYNVTKAAVIHMTRQLALELAPAVRVNAIAPGLVKTRMARVFWEPFEKDIAERVPLQRLGEVGDVAAAALFLASDASSWVTGHTLVVDGGSMVGQAGAR